MHRRSRIAASTTEARVYPGHPGHASPPYLHPTMPLHRADTTRFLRKLTARRVWNATKVGASYYATRLTRKPIQWGSPITISVEPTTACNLRCPECPSGLRQFSRPTGNLKQDFFRDTIAQLHRDLVYLIFYFQGEPYINPGFLDMVRHAHERGIYTITSTNGHFLSPKNARATVESGLDRVIISVDGTDQKTYEAYRKEGKLENVLQGARNLVEARAQAGVNHPHIIFPVPRRQAQRAPDPGHLPPRPRGRRR